MLMLFCLTAWRGGEIWIVARFGVHKVNYCSSSRLFWCFHFHCQVFSSAHSFCLIENKTPWWFCCILAPCLLIVGMITIVSVVMDDDGVLFSFPTVPGRGCQSLCGFHQERSAFIAKGLWVSHSLLLWKQRAARRLQLNPTVECFLLWRSEEPDRYTKHTAFADYYFGIQIIHVIHVLLKPAKTLL